MGQHAAPSCNCIWKVKSLLISDGDTIHEDTEDDEDDPGPVNNVTAGNESHSASDIPMDPPTPPQVRKRSMDDREEDEDLFENPVSMTIERLAPLSSISEVNLHNEEPCQWPLSTEEVHVW